ncbi:MAG: helix-turn-helix transcriptional regulator [Proteobacteria bacterium]|nr:helix-turn-helix transcriptional regulator [Pseudomonadota bacterium]
MAATRTPRSGQLDAALGDRIRRRRRDLGLSQSALGAKLGITFQQVQKYENGTNRVSATMLLKLSDALVMPVGEILHDVDPAGAGAEPDSQAAKLLSAFARIQSPDLRAAVLTLVTGLGLR